MSAENGSGVGYADKNSNSLYEKKPNQGRCLCFGIFGVLVCIGLAVGIYFLVTLSGNKLSNMEIEVKNGLIKGHTGKLGSIRVDEYLGIPYAQPPVGQLRYEDPKPFGSFPKDGLQAFSYQNSCWGYIDTKFPDFPGSDMWNPKNPLSENCLFLNVWVPRPKKTRAVMVWIFGGGYYSGSSALYTYDGKALANTGDVVVVSLNYRLGNLGFLTTGDGRIKGNFGLKDQQLALKWIKENIAAFGGDPNQITIFGESAGAASVGYHMLNPESAELFNRVILHSGAPVAEWAFLDPAKAKSRSKDFFKAVECPDDANVLECLRSKEPDYLINSEWVVDEFLNFPWAPNIDGDFLTDSPTNLVQQGKISKKDAILGSNKDEGTFWILYYVSTLSKDGPSLQTYQQFLAGVDIIDWDLSKATKDEVIDLYKPQDTSDQAANRDALDKISGDRAFSCPTLSFTQTLADLGATTYYYYLTHRASTEVWPDWMGVIHGADCQWTFGMPLNESRGYTDDEVEFSKSVMSYWANFAKTGNPNGGDLTKWMPYTASSLNLLDFKGPNNFVAESEFKEKYCPFWDNLRLENNEATTPLQEPQAKVQNGLINGHSAVLGDIEVDEYLGIPYAKPPVGQLRYAKPQPYGSFPQGGYNANSYQNSCWGSIDNTFPDFAGSDMWNPKNPLSEDCLFLNVWVPRPMKKRAVMVWIFGGGYFSGSSALYVYDGKALAHTGDVVVVSLNYRLGNLGFLTTGDGRIKGNFGLQDQQLALKWIKENIEAFGGDPDRITIFGESAGAASVGYHMLNPDSAELFNNVILQSGAPIAEWAFIDETKARSRSKDFFQEVSCPDDDKVLECLRSKEPKYLIDSEWVVLNFLNFPWAPNVDDDFLTDSPINLIEQGKYAKKDAILGSNKDEGTFWLLYLKPEESKDGLSLQTYQQLLEAVDIVDWDLSNATKDEVIDLYKPQDTSDQAANRDALDKISGDRAFTCPPLSLTKTLADAGAKTYYYYLTHRASTEVWPDWMGVIHGADCQWVFGMPLNASRGYTNGEVSFSQNLMSYWSNFAKTGDPNSEGLTSWPSYTTSSQDYLEFQGPNNFVAQSIFKQDYCPFWDAIRSKFNSGQKP